jgi:hypothetical protein
MEAGANRRHAPTHALREPKKATRRTGRTSAAGGARENHYRDPHVRKRILEFLGGDHPENLTSRFITADGDTDVRRRPRSIDELGACMDRGMEICRSLWDRDALVAHLDIEYVNFDFPGEAYRRPERVFDLQAPVIDATETLLRACGIEPLHILSGRGHHFVWQISRGSAPFKSLEELGRGYPSALQIEAEVRAGDGETIPPGLVRAFAGLGLVMEFVAGEIKAAAACRIPVELTAVEVGPSTHGREMISIDISEYGDPLHTRATRVPFSTYLKPWQQRDAVGPDFVRTLPPIYFIPLSGMDVARGVEVMRDPGRTAKLARRVSTRIPSQEKGMAKLIAKYVTSPLRQFHAWFYSHCHDLPEHWPETYDRTPLESLPACAALALNHPNDLLLRPCNMRMLTRVMLALGWHPRHVAGLIRSKFERDHQWGEQWQIYNPAMRADFYTRMFAGLFMTGRDPLDDFNCRSAQEEKICTVADCPWNLARFRESLLARKRYGYLAHRPFNGLFLPKEHL